MVAPARKTDPNAWTVAEQWRRAAAGWRRLTCIWFVMFLVMFGFLIDSHFQFEQMSQTCDETFKLYEAARAEHLRTLALWAERERALATKLKE